MPPWTMPQPAASRTAPLPSTTHVIAFLSNPVQYVIEDFSYIFNAVFVELIAHMHDIVLETIWPCNIRLPLQTVFIHQQFSHGLYLCRSLGGPRVPQGLGAVHGGSVKAQGVSCRRFCMVEH